MTIDNLISWLQEAEDNNTWLVSTQSVKRHLEKIKETEQLTTPVVVGTLFCDDRQRCVKKVDEERARVLLKATLDILKKCNESIYVKNVMETTAIWDEAECDGYCLMEEIEVLLEED